MQIDKPLDLPPITEGQIKRGLKVQTRYYYADSLPGNKATVVKYYKVNNRVYVLCNYGVNLSGQHLLQTMPLNALALIVGG